MWTRLVAFLQRVRVFSGFPIAFVYLIFSRPTVDLLVLGAAIAAAGLLIRAWACGHLRKTLELDTSGPYAYTRNPLYLGTFVIALGFGIASGVWWLFFLIVLYIGSIYLPVMNVEADVLSQRIGGSYEEYSKHVPILLPRLTPWKNSDREFDFQLYLANGEYNAAIGFAVSVSILAAKIAAPNIL